MPAFKDLTGQKFGRLTAIRVHGKNKQGRYLWSCRCECGERAVVLSHCLTSLNTRSCGCFSIDSSKARTIDLTGQRFGRLVVLSRTTNDKNDNPRWICRCDCGMLTTVRGGHLSNGHSQSCGCLVRDLTTTKNTKHGHSTRGNITAEYVAWINMWARCTNPKNTEWLNYGGRGITVCARWRKSSAFLADMGPKPSNIHSIDRKDVNKGYSPSNCRWATPKQQANNRRVAKPRRKPPISTTLPVKQAA